MASVRKDKVQVELEINGQKQTGKTLADLQKQYKQLNRELRNLVIGSEEYNKKLAETQQVKKQLDDQRLAIRGIGQGLNNASDGVGFFGRSFKKLGPVIKSTLISTGIGAIAVLIGGLVDGARQVLGLEKRFFALKAQLSRIAEGEDLGALSAQVVALEETFEQSQESIVGAAQAASEEYAQSYTESLKEIRRGLILVGEEGGDELLSQVDEYSAQFQQAGFSFADSVTLISQGINDGVFTDKAADSVKEFGLRIRDLTKAQEDVLRQNFGEAYADQLTQGVKDGSISTIEALDDVATRVDQLAEEGKNVQPIISNLFGGAGEDAAQNFIRSLVGVSDGLQGNIDLGNEYIRQQVESLEANEALSAAQEELTSRISGTNSQFGIYVTQAKTFIFEILTDFIDFLTTIGPRLDILQVRFKQFGNFAVNTFLDIISFGLKPLIEAIGGIDLDVEVFDADKLQGDLDAANQAITDKLEADEKIRQENILAAQERGQRDRQRSNREFQQGLTDEEKKAVEERAKVIAEAKKQIEDLRIQAMADGMEKELAMLQLQYQRRIEGLKGTEEQIAEQRALLLESQSKGEASIREKYRKQEEAARQRAADQAEADQQARFERELAQLEAQAEQRALAATEQAIGDIQGGADPVQVEEQLKQRLLESERRFLDQKLALYEQYGLDTAAIQQAQADQLLGITKDRIDKEIAEEQRLADERRRQNEQILNGISQGAGLAFDAIQTAQQNSIKKLEEAKERELQLAGDNADKKAAIEEKYQKQIDEIDKRQRETQKGRDILQSIINTALAVTRVISNPPLAIATGIAGAAQTAIIAATKYAQGGGLPDFTDQVVQGPSHAQHGVKLVTPTGRIVGEVEGGEMIFSKRFYNNNREFMDAMLAYSMRTRGAKMFADGGRLPTVNTTPSPAVIAEQQTGNRPGTDPALLAEIQGLRRDVRALDLVIGELKAKQIKDLADNYDTRKATTAT